MFGLTLGSARSVREKSTSRERNKTMKKLLAFIALALCGTLFAAADKGMTSSNIVGYQNKDAIKGMNYVTHTFRNISGGDLNVQDLQLDATVTDNFADFQRLNYLGGSASCYSWRTAVAAKKLGLTVPEGLAGVWVLETTTGEGRGAVTTYSLPEGEDAIVKDGDGFQIYIAEEGKQLMFAGAVEEKDMVQECRKGMNYVGNPFPQDISVQDFQLDATVTDNFADFQRLNYLGGSACLYSWRTKEAAEKLGLTVPEGLFGVWVLETTTGEGRSQKTTYSLPEGEADTVKAGDAIQVFVAEEGKTITVLCPYELGKKE